MRYKDPFYSNIEYMSKKSNNEDVHDSGFYELVNLLKKNNETDIYEIGFDFCQRLLYLEENGIKVIGGIEFNPTFSSYLKRDNIFSKSWDIKFSQLNFWNPIQRKTVITNNFLNYINEEDIGFFVEKLIDCSEKLYLNESIVLDLPKQGNIYVVTNERRDDIKVNSKNIELPCSKSYYSRPSGTE